MEEEEKKKENKSQCLVLGTSYTIVMVAVEGLNRHINKMKNLCVNFLLGKTKMLA